MIPMALPLIALGAALAQVPQGPHPQGVQHAALDMNVEVVSLLGQKLYRTPAEGDALEKLQANLAEADKNAAAKPDDPAMHVQRAKALGSLWLYHDAVQAYTKAIALTPTDAELFASRGKLFIVLRQFDQAKIDFEQATAIAPKEGRYWRDLGIANYLRQKFEEAAKAFAEGLNCSATDLSHQADLITWSELNQLRVSKPVNADAHVTGGMQTYVIGLEKLLAGDKTGALTAWRAMTDNLADWPGLAHIAAEAEIAAIEGSKKMKAITF